MNINFFKRIKNSNENKTSINVFKSVRFKLIVTVAFCFILSLAFKNYISTYTRRAITYTSYDIDKINLEISKYQNSVQDSIFKNSIHINDEKEIKELFNATYPGKYTDGIKVTDMEGYIIYSSVKDDIETLDMIQLNNELSESLSNVNVDSVNSKVTLLRILSFNGEFGLLVFEVSGEKYITKTTINYEKPYLDSFLAVIVFVVSFLIITQKKFKYIKYISNEVIKLSNGIFSTKLRIDGKDELSILAKNINYMSEELKNTIENERENEKIKSDLITNVSHDLKTPLTSIMGYLGLIKDLKYSSLKELNEYVNIAYYKSENLKHLIESLFEYTKLSNGEIDIKMSPFYIDEMLMQLIEEFVPMSDKNNIKIVTDIQDKKVLVYLEPNMIIRVFENLITNAIKYSFENTEIKISLMNFKDKVSISIKNFGENMSKEDLDKIFLRFYRVDKARASGAGGNGLGLAITKNIVDIHNGNIFVNSEDNEITFTVILPKNLNRGEEV